MPVTRYRYDDAGFPTYTGYTTLIGSGNFFLGLKNLLLACLVNGYGAKAPAGWSLVAEGTDYFILKNGPGTGMVCFRGNNSYDLIYISIGLTFTSMGANFMVGDGARSGTSANNAAPQGNARLCFAYNNNLRWVLIADDKTFVLSAAGVTDVGTPMADTTTYLFPFYAGEDSSGRFLCVGGQVSPPGNAMPRFDWAGRTVLRDPDTGLLYGTAAETSYCPALAPASANNVVVAPLPELGFNRVYWNTLNTTCGYLRGIAKDRNVDDAYRSKLFTRLGVAPADTQAYATPISLGDAHDYYVMAAYASSGSAFMTNNPAFW